MVEQTLPNRFSADQGDFFSVLNMVIEKNTPQMIENLCKAQLDRKIQAGFHRVLGKSPIGYESDFEDAMMRATRLGEQNINTGMLVLVEPRIPIKTQSELLGIKIHPSVSHFPSPEQMWTPYPVWVKVIDNLSDLTKRELIDRLPDNLRPASLFEAINADLLLALKDRKSITVPSLQKAGMHCLQKHPDGKVELSYMRGFYGAEDADSTNNNLYTRRRLHGAGILASYLDKA